MADINLQITVKRGVDGTPLFYPLPEGWKMIPVKITVPASSVYSTTDRARFDHTGTNNARATIGVESIKQIIFSNGFSAGGVNTSEFKAEWNSETRRLTFRSIGNGGPGVGPLNDAEIANATNLGNGTITAEAMIFV